MIDFKKKLSKEIGKKYINPIDLYNELDRSSTTGPLRPTQEKVLKMWNDIYRGERDVIVKLHTGEGKTLIGLLMLQSKLNEGEGPCVYVCPNKFLADQVYYEAKKFGIKVCLITENNSFPNDFIDGNAILLTYVQKIFNGRTIFGLDNQYQKVNTIVMDDAHACLDAIKQAYTVRINRRRNESIYNDIIWLFEDVLKEQGEGTFIDIQENEDYESVMLIPYWAWIDRKSEVISLLSKDFDRDYLKFTWPLIRDEIEKCDAYLNGKEIQIIPHAFNVERFSSFHRAKQRILMSATTQDDMFFVKNLDFSIDSISKPISCSDKKWSGEKMIIIPSLIQDDFTREKVIEYLCKFNWNKFGTCVIVPSKEKQNDYSNLYCNILNTDNIFAEITKRQDGQYGKTLVVANRYDGIDLPDDACRILILDSLPFFGSMSDIYEEKGRAESEFIRRKIAQKIEQGLGRGVRGEKDYCCIFIIGADLVKFIMSSETRNYFSPQTRKQIEVGLSIVEMSDDGAEKNEQYLMDLIKQSVLRDDGWKEYYKSEMEEVESDKNISNQAMLMMEKQSEQLFINSKYDESALIIQNFLNNEKLREEDKGWYLQEIARRKYMISRIEADKFQSTAFEKNRQLLKPAREISYQPFLGINDSRANNIQKIFQKFGTYDELILQVNDMLENLSYGVQAEKFERAMDYVGKILGFDCQRPDKMIRKGPDNLWKVGHDKYIMIECKSEVKDTRQYIYKSEVGQMENHCGWFEEVYHDASVLRIMAIITNNVAPDANFSHRVVILRKKNLKKLKSNIKKFIQEFRNYDIKNITETAIDTALNRNFLGEQNIWENYVEEVRKE